jgi:C4-dicarboxylate transporter
MFKEHPIITSIVVLSCLVLAYFIDRYINKKKANAGIKVNSEEESLQLKEELNANPRIAYLALVCWFCFIGGVIINLILKGEIHINTRYCVMSAIYLVGLASGVIAMLKAPCSIRRNIKKTQMFPTIFNGILFVIFDIKTLILVGVL